MQNSEGRAEGENIPCTWKLELGQTFKIRDIPFKRRNVIPRRMVNVWNSLSWSCVTWSLNALEADGYISGY